MKTQQQSNKRSEVYSTSGFRDTLASPVFYPVIVVALLLGITSILGFVQNPLKLKAVVNVIHQKVTTKSVVNGSLEDKLYSVMRRNNFQKNSKIESEVLSNNFNLFPNKEITELQKVSVNESFERFAFNYDVTSESFWTDLDSSSLETVAEAFDRKQREATTFGTPLKIDHQEYIPVDYNLQDKSLYALNSLK